MKIKTAFLAFAFCMSAGLANAQLNATPVCPSFTVDILAGSVNELVPKSAIVEVIAKFPALMGASRSGLFSMLGHPKLKDAAWDAYQMGYGTLILYYNAAGKINKIQMCSKGTDAIKLCQ